MERFFYLHAEVDEETDGSETAGRTGHRRPSVGSTRLSIFGKDSNDETVVIRVRGYRLHFYASFRDAQLCQYCCTWLALNNEQAAVVAMNTVTGYKSMLLDKEHQRGDATDYADTSLTNVVRFQVRTRYDVTKTIGALDAKVREYHEQRRSDGDSWSAVNYYESNMDVLTAATRRLGLDACRWCLFDTSLCESIGGGGEGDAEATAGREFVFQETGTADAATLFTDANEALPPRVKIMSFDIECLSSDAESMPEATRDAIIQISTVISSDALGRLHTVVPSFAKQPDEKVEKQHSDHLKRHLFTTGGRCGPIDGVLVHECRDEATMLREFATHVRNEDPDIVTGYNICMFDLPYLSTRIAVLHVNEQLGRCAQRSGETLPPRQYGPPKAYDARRLPGRIVFDMYAHLRKEVVLRSYTLNNVCAHFLDKKKDDVGYREIPTLYNGDAASRARLGRYCVKDAELVLELAFKTQTFLHAFERCKVFRTTLQYTVDRGQQAKFYSMLLAWCSTRKILVNDVTSSPRCEREAYAAVSERGDVSAPTAKRFKVSSVEGSNGQEENVEEGEGGDADGDDDGEDEREGSVATTDGGGADRIGGKSRASKRKRAGYEGATVLEPVPGLYRTPVICLDYASLYPSIMIAYNLCFTTFVRDEVCGTRLVDSGLAERSPIGYHFLTRAVKKGVIPSILEMLLEERAKVRRSMAALRDESSIEYKLLDGQQGALKIAANSIYGAIGCGTGLLYFVEIPASVTAYGRELIARTRDHVESTWRDAHVVYGDTDSVMVNLQQWDDTGSRRIWECAEIGRQMAEEVTLSIGREPIRLQFETVYRPFLLCTKKRYAAGVYNNLERLAAMEPEAASAACRSTIKYKGLQVVRRDNCTFSTRLMRFVLESLMSEKAVSIEHIAEWLREELRLLFDGRVNTKELVITKEWKRRCVVGQAHDRLAQRMEMRDPNSAPAVGDRVPYVVVTTPRGAKLSDRAEDPLYAMEHNLKPDLLYYADKQVATPIAELLRVVLQHRGSSEEIKDTFWPVNAPRRESDRRRRPGEVVWTRKAAVGCRRMTEFTVRTAVDPPTEAAQAGRELADVEDLLDGLADKCVACKDGHTDAVRNCRDRECETLYDRFAALDLRRRTWDKHRRLLVGANGGDERPPSPSGRKFCILMRQS